MTAAQDHLAVHTMTMIAQDPVTIKSQVKSAEPVGKQKNT
jgi:hypothetical protein